MMLSKYLYKIAIKILQDSAPGSNGIADWTLSSEITFGY